jgi:hypothetical protein
MSLRLRNWRQVHVYTPVASLIWVQPAVTDVVLKSLESFRTEGWGRAVSISTGWLGATSQAKSLKIRELEIFRFARNSPNSLI